MISKKPYIKPEVTAVALDSSLVLMAPSNPMVMHTMAGGAKGVDTPFQSPFDNKPFS